MGGFQGKINAAFEGAEGALGKSPLCDAIVAPFGGDYTLPSAACSGENNGAIIGIAPGTYTETADITMKEGQVLISLSSENYGNVQIDLGTLYKITGAAKCKFENIQVKSTSTTGLNLFTISGCDYIEIKNCYFDISGAQDATVFYNTSATAAEKILLENIKVYGNTAQENKLGDITIRDGRIDNIWSDNQVCPVTNAGDHYFKISQPATGYGRNKISNINIILPNTQGGYSNYSDHYVLYIESKDSLVEHIMLENENFGNNSCNGIWIKGCSASDIKLQGFGGSTATHNNAGLYIQSGWGYPVVSDITAVNCKICIYVASDQVALNNMTLIPGGGYNGANLLYALYVASGDESVFSNCVWSSYIYIASSSSEYSNFQSDETPANSTIYVTTGSNTFNNFRQSTGSAGTGWELSGNKNRLDNVVTDKINDTGTDNIINGRIESASDPTANNDRADNIIRGDTWLNSNTGILYRCDDNALGAAVWKVIDSGSPGYDIETNVASPVTCESGTQYDNNGSAGPVTYNLPTAAAGLAVRFINVSGDDMVITPQAGDTIFLQDGNTTTSVTMSNAGSVLELVCRAANEWYAVAVSGQMVLA